MIGPVHATTTGNQEDIMGSKVEDVSGFNTRYGSKRNKGYDGARGANIFPQQNEISWAAADPAGNYDSATQLLAGSQVAQVKIVVTEAFDGTPTLTVGPTAAPTQFVALADAVDLTTTGTTIVPVDSASQVVAATSAIRAVVGGAPSQGAATITIDYEV
jgi:hypothetical protein